MRQPARNWVISVTQELRSINKRLVESRSGVGMPLVSDEGRKAAGGFWSPASCRQLLVAWLARARAAEQAKCHTRLAKLYMQMNVCALWSCSQQLQIEASFADFFPLSLQTTAMPQPYPARHADSQDTHNEVSRALGRHQVHPDTGRNSRQVLKKRSYHSHHFAGTDELNEASAQFRHGESVSWASWSEQQGKWHWWWTWM